MESGWFKPEANVRVAVQSSNIVEGTVRQVTERGFYLTVVRELKHEGMGKVQPPREVFCGWNLFQWAELIPSAE